MFCVFFTRVDGVAGTAARGSLAPEDRDSNQLTHALADLNSELGEVQQAAALFEAAFTARLAALGPDHASTLHSQAMLAWVRGTKPGFTPSDRAWALETSAAVVSALRRIGQLHTEDGLQVGDL